MSPFLALSAAAGFASAIGHSLLSEKILLRPMFAARGDNRVLQNAATRRVIRWVFHLPSIVWALTAAAKLFLAAGAPYTDDWRRSTLPAFAFFGAAIYFRAAVVNAYALRRIHLGNVLLTIAGAGLLLGAWT